MPWHGSNIDTQFWSVLELCKFSSWMILWFQFWLLPSSVGCLRLLCQQQIRAPLSWTYSLNIKSPFGGSSWASCFTWFPCCSLCLINTYLTLRSPHMSFALEGLPKSLQTMIVSLPQDLTVLWTCPMRAYYNCFCSSLPHPTMPRQLALWLYLMYYNLCCH